VRAGEEMHHLEIEEEFMREAAREKREASDQA
jgi:hypothetical protein